MRYQHKSAVANDPCRPVRNGAGCSRGFGKGAAENPVEANRWRLGD